MEIDQIKKLTHFDHLNLYQRFYKDRIGTTKSWIFASRSNTPDTPPPIEAHASSHYGLPDAVVIAPYHQKTGKLVLIREFRVPLDGYQYGFPAGLMDHGETVEDTAERELKEETGLDLIEVIRKSPPIYSSSGMTDESVSMVYAYCSGTPTLEWNEASEEITVLMLSKEEAVELLQTPDLKFDVKTWIILSSFAETGTIL